MSIFFVDKPQGRLFEVDVLLTNFRKSLNIFLLALFLMIASKLIRSSEAKL